MKKVIIVTGCAGFIGSHFVETVLKNDPKCEVIGIDKITYAGNKQNMISFWDNERFSFLGEFASKNVKVGFGGDKSINFDSFKSSVDGVNLGYRHFMLEQEDIIDNWAFLNIDIKQLNKDGNYLALNHFLEINDYYEKIALKANGQAITERGICINDFIVLLSDISKDNDLYIVNFAAESHVDNSIDNAEPFIQSNINGVVNLLELAKELSIKKFVQISTDEVYGSLAPIPHTEESLLLPSSPYSASKASADLIALAYYITHDIPVCITRSSNNYGPRQLPEKVVPLFIDRLLNNKPVPLYGDGNNLRDWLWVQDNCDAIYKVLCNGLVGGIYNIGGTQELSNIELAEVLIESVKGEFDEKWIEYVEDRKGHDREYRLNCDKIKNELGWEPKVSFENGITRTVGWYQGVDIEKYFGDNE